MASNEQLLQHSLIAKASARANGDPFPGPLAEAFCKGAIAVGEYRVRKVTASDWVILRQIESPLIALVEEIHQEPGKAPEIAITDTQEWELCFQFTRPQQDSRDLLSLGRQHFTDAAIGFADNATDMDIKMICRVVIEQLRRSWETALKHKQDLEEKEGISFLAQPPAPKTG